MAEQRGQPEDQPNRLEIIAVDMDRATSTMTFFRSDRKHATMPLGEYFHASSAFVKVTYLLSLNVLMSKTSKGDQILAELPTADGLAPARGRKVAYLDQKDWSTLANAIHEPRRVHNTDELDAARKIIDLVEDYRLILPMSAGHMAETCKWTDDERRYRLALTILQMSRGWQMRDPLAVRRQELRSSFRRIFGKGSEEQAEVFTLEPYAIDQDRHPHQRTKGVDLPPEYDFMVDALTSTSTYFDVMLDAEYVGQASVPGWVDANQRFTAWLADNVANKANKRKLVELFFISDTRNELMEEAARVRLAQDEFLGWLNEHSTKEIAKTPSLGLFREVLYQKHATGSTKWEQNDLTDLMYLACAAGYADFVVGERSLVQYLNQAARRLGRSPQVFRNLRGLVSALEM